eukprot:TRINITY_DN14281_c0_g1_i2.p1 TRINITY_DN14281_c0_g1~~TRINITY_DN14281_c0_g1_i2.p1  ORF type:complete len:346 (+),score=56.44 TRINITY_DN14281_c0_g1_i2:76-1113(+)
MLVCCGEEQIDDKAAKKSKLIEEQLKKERRQQDSKVKLLLLGTGDSGKSTFVKQMKVIHKDGFSNAEIAKFQTVLQENCLQSMQRILQCENVSVPKSLKKDKEAVLEAEELAQCVNSIKNLWESEGIKDAFQRRSELKIQIPSTADYFFDHAVRFADENFIPLPDDMFRAKLKTTGISEVVFTQNGIEFTLVDVGGQRSERRKWLHCFDDVTSVIFLAALDEYDMKLEEDNSTNRLEESLRLFGEVTASNFFQPDSWILFLNKSDLFLQKIKKTPLHTLFKDISEDASASFEESCAYIQKRYIDTFKGQKIYPYVTCAIDTKNCERVFSAVRDTVITSALSDAGF